MPVIVRRQDHQRCSNRAMSSVRRWTWCGLFDSDKVKAWRVDPKINNVRNTGPELLNEVKDEGPPNGEEQIGMF